MPRVRWPIEEGVRVDRGHLQGVGFLPHRFAVGFLLERARRGGGRFGFERFGRGLWVGRGGRFGRLGRDERFVELVVRVVDVVVFLIFVLLVFVLLIVVRFVEAGGLCGRVLTVLFGATRPQP